VTGYVPARVARTSPELSLNDWAVLGIVAEGPKHGWAVTRELRPGTGVGRVWSVSRPVVYRSITTLVSRDYIVERGLAPSERGPQRTMLRATPRGRRALNAWLGTTVGHVRDLRSELLLKLALLDRAGTPAAPLIERQLTDLAPIFDAFAQPSELDGFDLVLWRWRRESIVAAERFLRSLLDDAAPKRVRRP
jgi:DNA-binding PadR family transcriptional regulator